MAWKKTGEDQYGGTSTICFYNFVDCNRAQFARHSEGLYQRSGAQGRFLSAGQGNQLGRVESQIEWREKAVTLKPLPGEAAGQESLGRKAR